MTYFQLPNPFMPASTTPTPESKAMVDAMIEAIAPKPTLKRKPRKQ
jgi:hypothetical protein